MRGCTKCNACQFFVNAHGDVLYGGTVAGFCGWGTVPCTINAKAISRDQGCALLKCDHVAPGVPHGKGVEQGKLWVETAHAQRSLELWQFKGVLLSQVCVHCQGEGVHAKGLRRVELHREPRWFYPCTECNGRGHHGERAA